MRKNEFLLSESFFQIRGATFFACYTKFIVGIEGSENVIPTLLGKMVYLKYGKKGMR